MPLCLYNALDRMDRPDLRGLNLFDLEFGVIVRAIVVSIRVDRGFGDHRISGFFDRLGFQSIDIDRLLVEFVQRFIYVAKLVCFDIVSFFAADQVQDDFGHSARFSVPGPLKDHVFHFAAA